MCMAKVNVGWMDIDRKTDRQIHRQTARSICLDIDDKYKLTWMFSESNNTQQSAGL